MRMEETAFLETDEILVERVLDGEKAAFDRLSRRHLQRCFRIARQFGLSEQDAADVVQETFLAAYRSLDKFDASYKFSTWLMRIHLNRLSNFRRGLRRAKKLFWRASEDLTRWEAFDKRRVQTPEEHLERSELQDALLKQISKLPKNQRVVFILSEMEGLKAREIAGLLDIPEGTVASRLYHARLTLRKSLRAYL